ncbi:MAG: hypothetical protein GY835_17910 [bacterium]|nr:hypothetical protein [bacterium]
MSRRKLLWIPPVVVTLCVFGALLMPRDPEVPVEVDPGTLGLERSQAVIDAKIARKEAKLAGTHKKPQRPDGYAHYRKMVRSHPEGTNVTQLLLEAKEHVKRMPQPTGDRDAGLWNWDWLGPGNIGGRVRAILTHPDNGNILWAASSGGGVWKTNDGGVGWYPLTDLMPCLAVSGLAMDPNDPDIIYAGTGEGFGNSDGLPGGGIFKSTNGGAVWVQLEDSIDPEMWFVNDLAHHPTQSGYLLACAMDKDGNGQVFRTTNGGEDWWSAHDPPASIGGALDIKFDPDDPDIVIAGFRHGAYRSNDRGAPGTWTDLAVGGATSLPGDTGRCEIAFATDSDFVYASCNVPNGNDPRGEIWRSEDNGVTWARRSALHHLNTLGWYANVIWVEPQFDTSIIVGGLDLYKSINGGVSLHRMSDWHSYHHGTSAHADQHVITPHISYDPEGDRTIFFGNDGGVQKNTEGFLAESHSGWINLANNLGITQFFGADVSPDGSIILGGTQDNDDLRFRREDGAQDWYQAETGDGSYAAINPDDTSIMYGAYIHLQIEKSTNGGYSYFHSHDGITDAGVQAPGDPDLALFIAPFTIDKQSPYTLIGGGRSIWRTTDHAANWNECLEPRPGNPLCSTVEICPTQGSQVVWVGYTDGQIWKTENTTVDWDRVDNNGGGVASRFITDIEISPHDPDVILAVAGGYNEDSGLYLSTNGGDSWTHRPGSGLNTIPTVHATAASFHPTNPDWIYLGTDIGLFASEDLGANWNVTSRYGSNEGPVFTEITDLIWHSYSTLIAVTHGRGMYECMPLETVWVDQDWTGEEDGTQMRPYNTFWEGYSNAGNGATLIIKGADYDENVGVLNKRIIIRGSEGAVLIH